MAVNFMNDVTLIALQCCLPYIIRMSAAHEAKSFIAFKEGYPAGLVGKAQPICGDMLRCQERKMLVSI